MLHLRVFYTFNSIFWGPFLSIRYFSKQSSSLLLYHVNFLSMNHALRGYFLGFCFSESIFLGFLSAAKYFFRSSSNTQLR